MAADRSNSAAVPRGGILRSADASPRQALLSTEQAARHLALSPRTLEALRLRGGGPAYVALDRRAIRYRIEDLESWIASRIRLSTSNDGGT